MLFDKEGKLLLAPVGRIFGQLIAKGNSLEGREGHNFPRNSNQKIGLFLENVVVVNALVHLKTYVPYFLA